MRGCKRLAAWILSMAVVLTGGLVSAQETNGVQTASEISVTGQLEPSDAGKMITLFMIKDSADPQNLTKDDIGHMEQKTVEKDGGYSFRFPSSKNADDYQIYMNLAGENVTASIIKANAVSDLLKTSVDIRQDGSQVSASVEIQNQYHYGGLTYQLVLNYYNMAGGIIDTQSGETKGVGNGVVEDTFSGTIPDGSAKTEAVLRVTDSSAVLEPLELKSEIALTPEIDIQTAANGTKAKSTATIRPFGTDTMNYEMWLAFFDEQDRLLDVRTSGAQQTSEPTQVSLEADEMLVGTARVKTMLWESASKMIPLCPVDEKDPQQEISCWGDSLTAGSGGNGVTYPLVLQELSGVTVHNMGAGGEDARTIAARQGGLQILVDPVSIPAEQEEVQVILSCSDGGTVTPMSPQKNQGINPCYIGGVEGTLREEAVRENGTVVGHNYYFTRSQSGETVTTQEKTVLVTNGMKEHRDDIIVIFSGQNKGYDDNVNTLVQMQQQMIDYLDYPNKRYVVVGLTTLYAEDRKELETAQEEAFGEHYINLREYLSSDQALIDGFGDETHTTIDQVLDKIKAQMIEEDPENGAAEFELMETKRKRGLVPSVLLSDNVHFNEIGYRLIGQHIYERMVALNILTEAEH